MSAEGKDLNAVERQRWGGPSPFAGQGERPLTRAERIEARHWLQQLSENARTVRNAMDPVHGKLTVTAQAWAAQWSSLKAELDEFAYRVSGNRPSPGGVRDRNE